MEYWFDRLSGMWKRGAEMFLDFWPVKSLFSFVSAALVYLFGGSGAILGVVAVEIILDTVTKWVAITKRYLIDQGYKPDQITVTAMICGFLYAWKPDASGSHSLHKLFANLLCQALQFISVNDFVIPPIIPLMLRGSTLTNSVFVITPIRTAT